MLTKSYAVYGDTSWKLTDELNLDAGVRWNEDQKTAHVYQADYASFAPTQLLPKSAVLQPLARCRADSSPIPAWSPITPAIGPS